MTRITTSLCRVRIWVVHLRHLNALIAFVGSPSRDHRSTANLHKLIKAAKCSLPALENLELRDTSEAKLKIPATFLNLNGSSDRSDLRLRTLILHHVFLPSISRLLSSAPALTYLALAIDTNVGPLPVILPLLSHLQYIPCLRYLDLEIGNCMQNPGQLTNPKEHFRHSNLTSFQYRGYTAYFDTLVSGFASPSLREVDISLYGTTLPPILHLPRFIEDIEESYYAAKVLLERDYFNLSLFSRRSEDDGDQVDQRSPQFRLRSEMLPESTMRISNACYARLTIVQELIVVSLDPPRESEDVIPWRRFLRQFRSVKVIRFEGTDNHCIASALCEDHGEPNFVFLPALKEIELCALSFLLSNNPRPSEMAAFKPFVSARQQAGLPVKVFWGPPLRSALRLSRGKVS